MKFLSGQMKALYKGMKSERIALLKASGRVTHPVAMLAKRLSFQV
jgi:hypothetical protein